VALRRRKEPCVGDKSPKNVSKQKKQATTKKKK